MIYPEVIPRNLPTPTEFYPPCYNHSLYADDYYYYY